ncbi:MAG: formyltransferase family protein, partial [Lactococcus raffinolactis]
AGVDTGQIIAQERVPVLPDDTLETFEARVHEMEYVLYPEVLKAILNQS